jgi:hypothetical protein
MKTYASLFGFLLVSLLGSGCVSTRYKLAPENTPGPVVLNLVAAPGPIEAVVHTVIALRGPGTWKRAAYWDEYVITIANRSDKPVTFESATLVDFRGLQVSPGDDPWKLETQSRRYETEVAGKVGDVLRVGGATVLTGAAAGSVLVFGGMHVATQAGAAAVLGGAFTLAAAAVAIPVYTIVGNVNGRHKVEAEFKRRRLALPAFLVPGQIVQGSVFFRISPGPQRLTLQCREGAEVREVTVDLKPLADLHLKTPVTAALTP